MDKVESIKEVIDYNVDTKDKNIGGKNSYANKVIHTNKIKHNERTEIIHDHQYNGQRTPNIK